MFVCVCMNLYIHENFTKAFAQFWALMINVFMGINALNFCHMNLWVIVTHVTRLNLPCEKVGAVPLPAPCLGFPWVEKYRNGIIRFFFLLPLVVYAQASVCKKNPHGSLCGELVGLLIFILSCARTMLVEWNIPARSGKEKIYACMSSSKTCKHGGQWASSVSKFSCVFGQCVSLLPGIITKLQTD